MLARARVLGRRITLTPTEFRLLQWSNRAAGEQLSIRLPRDDGAIIEQLVRLPGFADYLGNPDGQAPFILRSQAARSRVYGIRAVPLGKHKQLLVSLEVTDAHRVEVMRSTFVANVSHELRTPLTVVSARSLSNSAAKRRSCSHCAALARAAPCR